MTGLYGFNLSIVLWLRNQSHRRPEFICVTVYQFPHIVIRYILGDIPKILKNC